MGDLQSKKMSASEAVKRFIPPGTHVAFGGFTILRRPMAIARELVRQGIGDLYVTMNGGTAVEEMLAGAGLIRWLESTYLGLEGGMPVAYAILLRDGDLGRVFFEPVKTLPETKLTSIGHADTGQQAIREIRGLKSRWFRRFYPKCR